MLSSQLLSMLRSPDDGGPLTLAAPELLERLNAEIASGRLVNRAGAAVAQPLAGGLLRGDEKMLYPVLDGFPVMLADEAIPLDQLK